MEKGGIIISELLLNNNLCYFDEQAGVLPGVRRNLLEAAYQIMAQKISPHANTPLPFLSSSK